MKKIILLALVAVTLAATSCGSLLTGTTSTTGSSTSSTGGILGDILNGNTVTSIVNNVIGGSTINQDAIVGTWKYNAPGCAFTSENLLAKAGGAVAAAKIKEKLEPTYKQIGVNNSNTQITLTKDNQFSGKVDGLPVSGSYTFDSSTHAIVFKSLLMSTTGYVTRTVNGIGLMFESKKLLSVLRTVSALSGNSTLETVGEISKSYDGVRMGFEMTK
jgi:hypothetical protein